MYNHIRNERLPGLNHHKRQAPSISITIPLTLPFVSLSHCSSHFLVIKLESEPDS